jgi:hypothetical protein
VSVTVTLLNKDFEDNGKLSTSRHEKNEGRAFRFTLERSIGSSSGFLRSTFVGWFVCHTFVISFVLVYVDCTQIRAQFLIRYYFIKVSKSSFSILISVGSVHSGSSRFSVNLAGYLILITFKRDFILGAY